MIEYSSELDNNTQKHKEKGIRYHQNNEIASEEKKKGKTRQIRNSHLGKKKKKRHKVGNNWVLKSLEIKFFITYLLCYLY